MNILYLEIPKELQDEFQLKNLDYLTALSINNYFNNFKDEENDIIINGKKIDLINFNSRNDVLLLKDKFPTIKNYSHKELNEIYLNIEKQVQKLLKEII